MVGTAVTVSIEAGVAVWIRCGAPYTVDAVLRASAIVSVSFIVVFVLLSRGWCCSVGAGERERLTRFERIMYFVARGFSSSVLRHVDLLSSNVADGSRDVVKTQRYLKYFWWTQEKMIYPGAAAI